VSTPRTLDLPEQVRRVTVQTGRGAFAALEAMPGSGVCERRPALLIPGYTGSKEDFLAVLWPLAAVGRRVVAIDMRGQYETPGGDDHCHYGPDALAADIADIAMAVGQDDQGVHLLGHSFGGLIARQAVLAQTARISSLTLLGSGPGALRGQRATVLRAMLAELMKVGLSGRAERIAQLWESEQEPQAVAAGVPAPILAFLRERMLRSSPEGLVAMGKYLLSCPDQTMALAELAGAPILVLYGENDDAWAPATQNRMAKRLGAQRVCIPAAAHSPAVEAPETTASTLTAFWNAAESSMRRRKTATDHSVLPPGPGSAGDGSPGGGPAGGGANSSGAGTGGAGAPGSGIADPGRGAGTAGTGLAGPGTGCPGTAGAGMAGADTAGTGPMGASPSQGRRGSAAAMPSGQ
jgi:pimeloyl-ACP methyl ester carboxylesterase